LRSNFVATHFDEAENPAQQPGNPGNVGLIICSVRASSDTFSSRPSELPLGRRQRIFELAKLSKLADAHSADEFRDPTTPAHMQLVGIIRRLAVDPRPHAR
jgi:hypothetical protein